jgi:hypothetical protein
MGPDAGRRIARLGDSAFAPDSIETSLSPCATLGGFSLHAGVAVGATDRAGLERLCRYMARPPLASERLERLPDGRILYRLRHRWRDGTSAVMFEPHEFLARLAAQVPLPRAHQVRYHGVLAPCAAWRRFVVPDPAVGGGPTADSRADHGACHHDESQLKHARRIAWNDLLRRVFAVDALRCDRCGARMRVMAAVRSPAAIAAFLGCIRNAGRSPPAKENGAAVRQTLRHFREGEFELNCEQTAAESRPLKAHVLPKSESQVLRTLFWPVHVGRLCQARGLTAHGE